MSIAVNELRFRELLRRLLGARGNLDVGVLPDIMPVLPVVETSDTENYLARGDRWARAWVNFTATAGNLPVAMLRNASDSKRLVIVEHAHVRNFTAGVLIVAARAISPALTEDSVAFDKQFTDMRGLTDSITPLPVAIVGASSQAALTPFEQYNLPASGNFTITPHQVLRPGSQFLVWLAVIAGTIGCTFHWRERRCEPDELSPTGA